MGKKKIIKYQAWILLKELGYKDGLSAEDMYKIGTKLNDLEPKTKLEKRIRVRAFMLIVYFINLANGNKKKR